MKFFYVIYRHVFPWAVWLVAAFFIFYQYMLQISPSVMIPELMKTMSIDVLQIGILSSSFFYTFAFLQIPVGILIDRVGARRLLIPGIFFSAVACMLFAFSTHFWMGFSSRLLMGAMASPAIVATLYLVGRWFRPERFALMVGVTELFWRLGTAIGEPSLSALVGSSWGWHGTMVIYSLIGFFLVAVALFIVRDHPSVMITTTEQVVSEPEIEGVWAKLKEVMTLPQAWLLSLFTGLMYTLTATFAALWCIPYMQQRYGLSLPVAAVGVSMVFWGSGLSAPFFGWLSDFISRRKPVLFIGTFLTLASLFVVLYWPALPLSGMYIALFFMGVGNGVYIIPYAMLREVTPKSTHGTAMGYLNMICVLVGGPLLQPLIGLLLEYQKSGPIVNGVATLALQDYQIALSVLSVCIFIAFILIFFMPETRCRPWRVIRSVLYPVSVSEETVVLDKE